MYTHYNKIPPSTLFIIFPLYKEFFLALHKPFSTIRTANLNFIKLNIFSDEFWKGFSPELKKQHKLHLAPGQPLHFPLSPLKKTEVADE